MKDKIFENKKNILLGVLIVGVIAMTVAFAALSTNLKINGSANVAATSWNIHFYNWQKVDLAQGTTGHTNTAVYPAVNQLSTSDSTNITKVEGVNVTLNQPGDVAKYTFEIVNDGSIAARLSNFEVNITPSSNVIGYEVKCFESNTRTGTEVEYNSTLAANGGKAYCYLQVEYNDVTNSQTPGTTQTYTQSAVNTSLSATWTWIQDNGSLITGPVWSRYYTPTQSQGVDTLPAGATAWIQVDTTTINKELCGIMNGQTVCIDANSLETVGEFTYDYEESTNVLPDYAKNIYDMMEGAGASCSISSEEARCDSTESTCSIFSYGSARCMDDDGMCTISDDGTAECVYY